MKIAIIGAGRMGAALGRCWSAAGHNIIFSYSRSPARLSALADQVGAQAATPAQAAALAEVVLLAVHWSQLEDALTQAGDLTGKTLISCCVPLDPEDEYLLLGGQDSGIEFLARCLPATRIAGAFTTCPSEVIPEVFSCRHSLKPAAQMLYYCDHESLKPLVAGLIDDIGFEPVFIGGLANGRFVEPFAMVTAALAYGQPGGAELIYRFDRLGKATKD
ncbi:NADPH-dependent F420 reductase [Pokkaliibacter sp. CJK22405]|uniref:NADPH-dependent F420 reductase n=1 Tax=Pokkaliibacter sp. CJK22405 TaxID=3384615 RepID=UPI003984AE3A